MKLVRMQKQPETDVRKTGLCEFEYQAFDMYFASLASMQVHPGAGTKGSEKLTLEQCRDMALDMLNIRRQVALNLNPEKVGE